ncbi:GTPase Era [Dialister pneumosintes]|jgi:GTP-binding protein Era|uniref:GTPase Era n=1 Tax=Dialister pneumosintes TaxID=39950 RepID=A0ABX9MAV7_9FIRM|nr:GTPase Era [Dialister pneumosintes]MBS6480821.1 GTPase Era [Dialister sp.]RID94292.1 GTPase Era [Dialister pneumosintes]CDF27889.1 gTPase Era [Dialister sp. CAG:588]
MVEEKITFRSGFVALVGRPNVGKSTLLNAVLGEKISIVSRHAQTTRNKITGVWNGENSQVVFLDTPGMHKPKSELGKVIRQSTVDALSEVDVIVFICSCVDPLGAGDRYILSLLKERQVPVILALNKIDLITKEELMKKVVQYNKIYDFADIVPISAQTEENIDTFLHIVETHLKEGPKYFPDDMVTDQPERNIVQEIVREKIITRTRDEIPHAIGVFTEEFSERENGKVYIRCTVYVERESQKRIIIGKKGVLLKEAGKEARTEIQNLINAPVFLDLWVKVHRDWKNKDYILRELGYKEHK